MTHSIEFDYDLLRNTYDVAMRETYLTTIEQALAIAKVDSALYDLGSGFIGRCMALSSERRDSLVVGLRGGAVAVFDLDTRTPSYSFHSPIEEGKTSTEETFFAKLMGREDADDLITKMADTLYMALALDFDHAAVITLIGGIIDTTLVTTYIKSLSDLHADMLAAYQALGQSPSYATTGKYEDIY